MDVWMDECPMQWKVCEGEAGGVGRKAHERGRMIERRKEGMKLGRGGSGE